MKLKRCQISNDLPSNIDGEYISVEGAYGAIGSLLDRDVLTQFERAKEDLNTLILYVGVFVDWWGEMKTSLANLEDILPRIKVDGTNPFRAMTVQEQWMKVHAEYISYQRQVRQRHLRLLQVLRRYTFAD
jgi:hypothetical protein